jgi:hypothetical protein
MDRTDRVGCPMTSGKVLEEYFMENRAKLLDIAAFLDRVDRVDGNPGGDFRYESFCAALVILADGSGNRAARILDQLSDPTPEPLESASGMKGAHGAWPGYVKAEGQS